MHTTVTICAHAHAHAHAIAETLGNPWRFSETASGLENACGLTGPDGMAIVVQRYVGPHGARLALHGIYLGMAGRPCSPHHLGALKYREEPPTFSVDISMPVAETVRLMRHRFLPGYLALFRQCEMIVTELRAKRATTDGVQKRLLRILHDHHVTTHIPSRRVAEIHFQKAARCRHGIVSIGAGETCDLRLDELPPALAGEILAMVVAL